MMIRFFIGALVLMSSLSMAQQKVGDKWVDNNLTFNIIEDQIKTNGIFTYCIFDGAREQCIENLSCGVLVSVYNIDNEILWEGQASGRTKKLKLIAAMPDAHHLVIKAFKPWVVNRSTGTQIFQEQPIEIKYFVK